MIHAIGISGSLRAASSNTGLLRFARSVMPAGMTLELLDIRAVPLYNEDTAAADRTPAVASVMRAIAEADALVLAVPEYNYSFAPALKNVLDWASREDGGAALAGKPAALLGAAGGMGSSRAQYHLRQVCVRLNLQPLAQPEVFANAYDGSFDAAGTLLNPQVQDLVRQQMEALHAWTLRLQAPARPWRAAA
jgi:chromate reductase